MLTLRKQQESTHRNISNFRILCTTGSAIQWRVNLQNGKIICKLILRYSTHMNDIQVTQNKSDHLTQKMTSGNSQMKWQKLLTRRTKGQQIYKKCLISVLFSAFREAYLIQAAQMYIYKIGLHNHPQKQVWNSVKDMSALRTPQRSSSRPGACCKFQCKSLSECQRVSAGRLKSLGWKSGDIIQSEGEDWSSSEKKMPNFTLHFLLMTFKWHA